MLFKILHQRRWIQRARSCHSPTIFSPCSTLSPFLRLTRGLCVNKPLCHSRSQRVACAQALLFGRAKREARTRELTARGRVSSRVPLACLSRVYFSISPACSQATYKRAAVWTVLSAVISQDYAQLYHFPRPSQ